jgi:N-acetylmuramoyl-L-alanine amidase
MKLSFYTYTLMICCILSSCAQRTVTIIEENAPICSANLRLPAPSQEIAMSSTIFRKRPENKIMVMLDAGHGGEDFGTHSLGTTKYHEKYLNLSTTMMVKNFLQQFGFEVILTRADDSFISLDKRSLFANEQKPRLFVSIHFNSAPSIDAEGIEVFYYKNEGDKTRTNKSQALAQAILDKTIQNTKAKSRGIKHGNFLVIRETTMPSALIEGGFLTNTNEMEKIKTAAYLKSLALGIAQGIQDYLSKDGILAERP